jgi:hypothetical protein
VSSKDQWAPWVMRIRGGLLPYRRTLAVISLALMVFLFCGSIRTELWAPISEHPRKVQGLALLVGLLAHIFLSPGADELREWRDRAKARRPKE